MTRLLRSSFVALMLVVGGCSTMAYPFADGGGGAGGSHDMGGGGPSLQDAGDADALPPTGRTFSETCDNNAQCASMLCTMDSYDRLTHPICTAKCDPAAPSSPQCPDGCNMKGYCRLPK